MKYIVDRIENEIAVCEAADKSLKNFMLNELYEGVKEGDHFEFVGETCVFLQKDTDDARNKNIALLKSLFEE